MQVNVQQENQDKVFEKIYNFRQSASNASDSSKTEKQFIEIKRYLKDDLFAVKTNFETDLSIGNFHEGIQINGKDYGQSSILNFSKQKGIIFPPSYFKNLKFSEIKKFAHYLSDINSRNESKLHFLSTLSIKDTIFQNSIQIKEDYVHFKIPRIIRFYFEKNSDKNSVNLEFLNFEISYFNVVLFPQKFERNKFNKIIYKLAIFNDDGSSIERDLSIVSKNIENLPLKNSKSLKTSFSELNSNEIIENFKINGKIEISDETYSKDNLIYKGISENSSKGFFISDNIDESFNTKLSLNISENIKNIDLGLFFNFKKNRPEIKDLKLTLKEITENEAKLIEIDFFELKKELFLKIIKGNFTLAEIKNISFKKRENES